MIVDLVVEPTNGSEEGVVNKQAFVGPFERLHDVVDKLHFVRCEADGEAHGFAVRWWEIMCHKFCAEN